MQIVLERSLAAVSGERFVADFGVGHRGGIVWITYTLAGADYPCLRQCRLLLGDSHTLYGWPMTDELRDVFDDELYKGLYVYASSCMFLMQLYTAVWVISQIPLPYALSRDREAEYCEQLCDAVNAYADRVSQLY